MPPGAQAPRPLFLPRTWLLSPATDTLFLHASVLVSLILYALWQARLLTSGDLVLLWVFVFHGPHFWATISRTYLDRAEWRQRGRLLAGSLAWFLVGPAIVGLALWSGVRELQKAFFFTAALWAYHHVVKQHFGFMALYRARAGERDRRELLLHKYYLVISLWMPALITLSGTPDWLAQIPFVPTITADNAPSFLDAHAAITAVCTAVFWSLQALFALHLLARTVRGRGVNLQEVGIAACAVTLHWVVVRAVLARPDSSYAFVPLVTVYHNVQYHALVWQFNRRRYHVPDARARHGLAAAANRWFPLYFALGVAYTFLTIGVDFYRLDVLDPAAHWFAPVFAAAVWGYSFLHYWLDSKIWHVRQDAGLRRVLGFDA